MSEYIDDFTHKEFNAVAAIVQLQNQKAGISAEIDNVKQKLITFTADTNQNMKTLEESIQEIRDMARDVMHISVGVDGRNGLRGSMHTLTEQVHVLVKEFNFLRQTADSYMEMRSFVLKFFATAAFGLFLQFAGAIWYFSGQHQQQQALRNDLNKVLSYIDKQQDVAKK